MSLRERTGHIGSLLSLFPVDVRIQIDQAVRILREGGVVGMPTETVYGLAASIESEAGLKKVFAVKERPYFDPLIVHISDLKQLNGVTAEWSSVCQKLAESFWPGPLTIVTEKNASLNNMITSGLETVAVRMPAHPVALALISETGVPLAAPSANKFGKTSPTEKAHVASSFPDILVLEGGPSTIGIESTVVRVERGQVSILRPGYVTAEDLERVVGKVQKCESEHSPGHMLQHYQPEIPLIIIRNSAGGDGRPSLGGAHTVSEGLFDSQKPRRIYQLILNDDPFLAARTLYQKLREASQSDATLIELYWKPQWTGGLWEAIWDRVKRASTIRY